MQAIGRLQLPGNIVDASIATAVGASGQSQGFFATSSGGGQCSSCVRWYEFPGCDRTPAAVDLGPGSAQFSTMLGDIANERATCKLSGGGSLDFQPCKRCRSRQPNHHPRGQHVCRRTVGCCAENRRREPSRVTGPTGVVISKVGGYTGTRRMKVHRSACLPASCARKDGALAACSMLTTSGRVS